MQMIALLGDAHGNLPALEAVLADIDARGIERIIFMGDAVGKGPSSCDAVDLLFARCEGLLRGNWEDGICAPVSHAAHFFHDQLGAARLLRLRALPQRIDLRLSGRSIKLFHGRPILSSVVNASSPHEMVEMALDSFGDYADIVGFADSHSTFLRTYKGRILFNTGSVGNPCDGLPQASYAILRGAQGEAPASLSVELVRVPYDHAKAQADAIACVGLPCLTLYLKEIETGIYQRS